MGRQDDVSPALQRGVAGMASAPDFKMPEAPKPYSARRMRANAKPRLYNVDYSRKNPECGPKHWGMVYEKGLRSGYAIDDLLKSDRSLRSVTPRAPNFSTPRASRAARPSTEMGPTIDGNKYIPSPAQLSLEGLMAHFISELKIWRERNTNGMSQDEDSASQTLVDEANQRLIPFQFREVRDHEVFRPKAKDEQKTPEGPKQYPAILLPCASNPNLRRGLANPSMGVMITPLTDTGLWNISDETKEKHEKHKHLHPWLKPVRKMHKKKVETTWMGLLEAFKFYACADPDSEKHQVPQWSSRKQWEMFIRGFSVAEVTGISEEDLHTQFLSEKIPISYQDFINTLVLVAKCALELYFEKDFNEISVLFKDDRDGFALYRFAELFGFHNDALIYRQYLRGRETLKPEDIPKQPQAKKKKGKFW